MKTYGGSVCWDVSCDDCVRANSSVVSNRNAAENFCTRPDIDVAANNRNITAGPRADSHLLENQAINADHGIWMDHDTIWMGQKKSATNLTVQGNVSPGYSAPKPMTERRNFANEQRQHAGLGVPSLIEANCREQFTARMPELLWSLARPIRDIGAD